MPNLPKPLAAPVIVARTVVSKVLQDLTIYLIGPSEIEFDHLVQLYNDICPPDRLVKYKIAEFESWSDLSHPLLTESGRRAQMAGITRPYLEPVRQRIRTDRAFEIRFWDGRPINDPEGTWSFSCIQTKKRASGLHAFVRILFPLQVDHQTLAAAAMRIANAIRFYSGHGGLSFVYDPWQKETAFDAIYSQARRFWGVDIEDLNETLPLMRKAIKGVNWITMIGNELVGHNGVLPRLDELKHYGLAVTTERHGSVIVAGKMPLVGDQNRARKELAPYYAVAQALAPLFLTQCPDFPSEEFLKHGNTLGWIRRFIEPNGWR